MADLILPRDQYEVVLEIEKVRELGPIESRAFVIEKFKEAEDRDKVLMDGSTLNFQEVQHPVKGHALRWTMWTRPSRPIDREIK